MPARSPTGSAWTTVHIHPLSGVLSAYGMGLADIRAIRSQAAVLPLAPDRLPELEALRERLRARSSATRLRARACRRTTSPLRRARISATTAPTRPSPSRSRPAASPRCSRDFEAAHKAQFGFVYEDKPIVAEVDRGRGVGGGAALDEPDLPLAGDVPDPRRTVALLSPRAPGTTPASICREALKPGHRVAGPALIIEPHQTIVVEPGWDADVTAQDHIVLTRRVPRARAHAPSAPTPTR